MKIVVDRTHFLNGSEQMTYQAPFEIGLVCPDCKGEARLIALVEDDEGLVCKQDRPKGVKVWPHDAMAIALYLCTSCGKMIAKWNQG